VAEFFEEGLVFAGGAPERFVGRLPGGEFEGFGRFLAFVEELIDGDFEGFGEFFERSSMSPWERFFCSRRSRSLSPSIIT
jgi:hypothetical protein